MKQLPLGEEQPFLQQTFNEISSLNAPDMLPLLSRKTKKQEWIKEDVKYYFADFVRKGGGDTPQIRNFFLAKFLFVKGGGGTPLTDKIRKVVFDVFP